MNTLQSLIDNGIELYTAQSMIDNYSSKINTMNGIYIITQKKTSKSQSINISLLGMKAEIQKPRNFYSYWITHTEKQTKEKYPEIYKKYEHLIHRI